VEKIQGPAGEQGLGWASCFGWEEKIPIEKRKKKDGSFFKQFPLILGKV